MSCISICLSFAGFLSEAKTGPSCGVPKGWESWLLIPLSFSEEGNSSSWRVTSDTGCNSLGVGMMQTNEAVLPSPFVFSGFFPHPVAEVSQVKSDTFLHLLFCLHFVTLESLSLSLSKSSHYLSEYNL